MTYGNNFELNQQDHDSLSTKISGFSTFQLHPFVLKSDLEYSSSPTFSVVLNVGDDSIALQLQKGSLASSGAMINVHGDSSNLLMDLISSDVYSGFVDGDTNQVASFIVREDDVFGYYQKKGEMWFISKLTKFIESPNSAPQTTFVKFKDIYISELGCATEMPTEELQEDTSVISRTDGVWHFELAYDVDYAMYTKFNQPGQEPAEERIRKYLEEVTLTVQGFYQQIVPSLYFHIVDINIWSSATQPYTHSGNIQSHWNQGKNWWSSNKGCIQRDAVTLMSGLTSLSASGYVAYTGVHSICSTRPDWACVSYPYNAIKHQTDVVRTARSVAHELAHNFGQQYHACACNIMYAGSTTSSCDLICTNISNSWDFSTRQLIQRRFYNPFELCNPSGGFIDSDICLRSAPPVDLDFNLSLEANQVILTTKSVVCPGEEFTASFYNQNDPNSSIQWELGPNLQFATSQPSGNKSRNILVSNSCCYPFDTWIKVTFNHNCGGPFSYIRKVRVNSAFGLSGVYAGPSSGNGSIDTIASVNFVVPGSYDIRLENTSATYTWVQTIGNNPPVTLPYTTYAFSFGIQSSQTISFTAETTNTCGYPMSRTFTFYAPSFRLAAAPNEQKPKDVAIYPNPSTGTFFLRQADGGAFEPFVVRVFDFQGKVIRAFTVADRGIQEIDLSGYPSGVYILQVIQGDSIKSLKLEKL